MVPIAACSLDAAHLSHRSLILLRATPVFALRRRGAEELAAELPVNCPDPRKDGACRGFGVKQDEGGSGCQKGMGTCVRARLQPAVKTSQNRTALAAVFAGNNAFSHARTAAKAAELARLGGAAETAP